MPSIQCGLWNVAAGALSAAAVLLISGCIEWGADVVATDSGEHSSSLRCEPGNRDFTACGDSGVCFDGVCCDGCWRFACPNAKCELVCVTLSECD